MAGISIGRRAIDEGLFVIGIELDRLGVVGDRFLELLLVALIEGAGAQRARSLLDRERAGRQRARIKRNGSSAVMALIGGLRGGEIGFAVGPGDRRNQQHGWQKRGRQ